MAELSVKDHLEGILSDFEALKRSFDIEDVDDPELSPSSSLNSPYIPSSAGMSLTGSGESRRSSGSHQPVYQTHISISSNSSPAHSPVLKTRISSSLSFNRGTIQIAKSNGSTRSNLTRVSSFQTRLNPNGFSMLGPGSDSESLHSSTSSLECQPATKLIASVRSSQSPLGQPESNIRISKISSPVLKKFSSHGSVFHSEIERPGAGLVPMTNVNHNSLPSLDLHIAEDQGPDLIPSPDVAYSSAAAWNAPAQSCTMVLSKNSKPISREPSFSSSSSSSPPPDVTRPNLAGAPIPVIRPTQLQLNKLQKFPISLKGLDEKPPDGPSLDPGTGPVSRPLPRTQLKVNLQTNISIQTKPTSQQPVFTAEEETAEPVKGMPGIPSLVPLPIDMPVDENCTLISTPQFQLVSQLGSVQEMSSVFCSTPLPSFTKDYLKCMIERANSFTRADGSELKAPVPISALQNFPHGGKTSRSSGGLVQESHIAEQTKEVEEFSSYDEQRYHQNIPNTHQRERRLEAPRISMAEQRRRQQVTDRDILPPAHDAETDIPGSEPFGYVGIEAVLDQMRRKAMKMGLEFNIMVVGQSGLGKSTLVNTLFKSKIYQRSTSPEYEKIPKTVELRAISHVIEEKGLKMKLTVIDTPGFGDQINNQNCWDPIIKYIAEQYEKYLREEMVIQRKRRIPDSRIHCCIYFVPPTGHWLRPLDVEFMKRLSKIVNIVPVIAKSDTLTLEEREEFKQQIRKDLQAYGISVYPQRELDEDLEDALLNERIREKIPFAVVGTDREHQVNGKKVLGRKTNWGMIEVENMAHCEFANLRDMLIRTNLQDLKDITHYIHYESYRIRRLSESNLLPQSPELIPPYPKKEQIDKEELENVF
uniref:Septin-12 isoform X2 n=1 Tax=Geotrypetes seraphini TaxID=260995 RepID=A0A6P8SJT9_GEOSA|nr:septin-12 isoform X2 [Geotrypetes seraphini]